MAELKHGVILIKDKEKEVLCTKDIKSLVGILIYSFSKLYTFQV